MVDVKDFMDGEVTTKIVGDEVVVEGRVLQEDTGKTEVFCKR